MAGILLPSQWTRQPPYAALANQRFNVIAAFNGAAPIGNAGPGGAWSASTQGVSNITAGAGQALRFAGSTNTGKWTTGIPSVSGDIWAVFVVANLNGTNGGGGAGRIISCFNGSTFGPIDVFTSSGTTFINVVRSFSTTNAQYNFPNTLGLTAKPDVLVVWMPATAGVAPRGWCNGIEQTMTAITASVGTVVAGNTSMCVGGRPDVTTRQLSGDVYMAGMLQGAVDPVGLSLNPWQIFAPQSRRLWVPGASSGVTGTVATTLGSFTSSATGTTTVTGNSAQTLASFAPAATGTTTVTGTSAQTLAAFTSNASGSVGSSISGTVAATLDPFTSSATGTTAVTGASAQTLASFTPAATGTTTVTGTSAQTLAAFTATASGFAGGITGTVAATLDAFTSSASGSGGPIVDTQTGGYTSPQRLKKPRTWNFASTGVLGLQGQGTCTHIPPRVQRHQAQGRAVPLGGAARVTRANPITARLRRQAKVAMLLKL